MEITNDMLAVLDQSKGPAGLIECIEISHSKWPWVLRYVINSNEAMTLTHEDVQAFEYIYAPVTISRSADQDTLEQELSFTLGDVGEAVPALIDLFIHDEVIELPIVSYRAYLMGHYDAPIFVARDLELESVMRDWKGTRGDSRAPGLNDNGNGDVYSPSTDPSLGGFY